MKPSGHDVNPDVLRAFLATAPTELQSWADEQLAQLSGASERGDGDGADQAKAKGAGSAPRPSDDAVELEVLLPDYERTVAEGAAASSRKSASKPAPKPRSRINLVLLVLLIAAVVVIIQQAGAPTQTTQKLPENHPSIAASAQPSEIAEIDQAIPVDKQREAELKAAIEADPKNIDARQDLGEMYLTAALYQDAITYFQQVLDIEPNNVDALLAIGVAQYQTNLYDEAEASWLAASQQAPDTAEPWYNLGFLYMAMTPPQPEKANQCWEKVLAISPNSEMAAAVRDHQTRLNPSPAPTTGG